MYQRLDLGLLEAQHPIVWPPKNHCDWTRAVAEQPDSGSAEFAHYRSPASPAYLDERVSDLPPNSGQVSSYTIRGSMLGRVIQAKLHSGVTPERAVCREIQG